MGGFEDLPGGEALPQGEEFEDLAVVVKGQGQQRCLLWGHDAVEESAILAPTPFVVGTMACVGVFCAAAVCLATLFGADVQGARGYEVHVVDGLA
jgi:hypothetical protein